MGSKGIIPLAEGLGEAEPPQKNTQKNTPLKIQNKSY